MWILGRCLFVLYLRVAGARTIGRLLFQPTNSIMGYPFAIATKWEAPTTSISMLKQIEVNVSLAATRDVRGGTLFFLVCYCPPCEIMSSHVNIKLVYVSINMRASPLSQVPQTSIYPLAGV